MNTSSKSNLQLFVRSYPWFENIQAVMGICENVHGSRYTFFVQITWTIHIESAVQVIHQLVICLFKKNSIKELILYHVGYMHSVVTNHALFIVKGKLYGL